MPFIDPTNMDVLGAQPRKAAQTLDLRGQQWDAAGPALSALLEAAPDKRPEAIEIRIDPATQTSGETLFQPLGRALLAAQRAGVLARVSPLPLEEGAGFYAEFASA